MNSNCFCSYFQQCYCFNPDDTEDYIHQVSTNVLFRKIDAIRRPLGLAFVLLFWLCFIDSGHQIKTRHNSLGFWFYFPKVLVCSSVWAALSAYACFMIFHTIMLISEDILITATFSCILEFCY